MRTAELTLALACAMLLMTPAAASVRPSPGPVDPKVKVAAYEPGQVYDLTATLRYEMTIEFGPGERIENVGIGDALGWQITPNRRADLLFVKPLQAKARTNMTVITNLRRYNFTLSARAPEDHGGDLTYAVRFAYPEPAQVVLTPPPAPLPPQDLNHAYSFAGSGAGLPSRIFDDGRSTYFSFPDGADLPAIFVTDAGRHEAVANVTFRDGFLVIDQVAAGFALRRGDKVTWIANAGFHPPDEGGLPPTPDPRKRPRP